MAFAYSKNCEMTALKIFDKNLASSDLCQQSVQTNHDKTNHHKSAWESRTNPLDGLLSKAKIKLMNDVN